MALVPLGQAPEFEVNANIETVEPDRTKQNFVTSVSEHDGSSSFATG